MEEITRANTLVEAADKGGNAQRYAAGDLQRAHDELADANRADTAGKYEEAKNFAESAAVDANLAAARGAAGDAKRAATEVVQSNATLRGEANRAVDNSIATPGASLEPTQHSKIHGACCMNNTVKVAIATLLLTGCASAPVRNSALEDARAQTDALAQEPLAQQAASDDLKMARTNVQAGDLALQQKDPPAVVDHFAYLAQRSAEAGEARVQEAQAKAQVASARG